MKKSLLYAMIACVTFMMPKTIKAAEAYAALSNDNTTLTFYYDNEKSSRNGMDIGPFEKKKDRGWHEYSNEITTVVFDASFTQKTDLVSTAYWFKGFGKLTTITGLENLNTHKVIDMSSMFDDCSSLKKIDLSSFNTENVENMQGMFIECESLTTLDLRNFNTSKVKNMSMMFAGCVNLNNPYLKTFNTENVTEMWSMFENCEKLTELDVSNFNTSNVMDMRYMFADCYCLPKLDLSSFNTSNVTNMNCLFQGSKTLKTVYVSDEWNTAKVEKGERVFNDCNIIIGGKGTVYDENHTDYTYAHIDGGVSNPGYLTLKTGDIPDINTDKVEAYAALSNDNTTLTFYYDNEKSSRNGMDIGPFESSKDRGWDDCRKIITTVIFDDSFAQYSDLQSTSLWFKGCMNLTAIIGIENLKTSNVTDMSAMFAGCRSLISLDVRGFDTQNVNNMAGMFTECESLLSIDLSNFDTRNVENMGYMFSECDVIQTIDLSSFNTEKVTTMVGMFGHCNEALKVLDLSSFNTSNVTDMRKMFFNSPLLTTVYVSNGWSTKKVEKGDDMFKECNSIIGGNGTKWDENHTDYTYAQIDGGPSNPGYLSKGQTTTILSGDLNDDGEMDVTDVVELIDMVLAGIYDAAADINGDGEVDVTDVVELIDMVLSGE